MYVVVVDVVVVVVVVVVVIMDGAGGAEDPRCWPAFGRRRLSSALKIVIILDDGAGGLRPPGPPLLAGLRPAGNFGRFAIRLLDFNNYEYDH